MARLKLPQPRASWQGPAGAACVITAVALLTAWPWGLLAAGVILLLAAMAT